MENEVVRPTHRDRGAMTLRQQTVGKRAALADAAAMIRDAIADPEQLRRLAFDLASRAESEALCAELAVEGFDVPAYLKGRLDPLDHAAIMLRGVQPRDGFVDVLNRAGCRRLATKMRLQPKA
ncbi:MAG TPA: hypothetical protein VNF49_11910 [Candidatus Binataceae bacterium]|nr:hypothetical protein [Candidatus Binataceae bacterium]